MSDQMEVKLFHSESTKRRKKGVYITPEEQTQILTATSTVNQTRLRLNLNYEHASQSDTKEADLINENQQSINTSEFRQETMLPNPKVPIQSLHCISGQENLSIEGDETSPAVGRRWPEINNENEVNIVTNEVKNKELDIANTNTDTHIGTTDMTAMNPKRNSSVTRVQETIAVGSTLAITYILLVIVSGATCYIQEFHRNNVSNLAEGFNIYLMTIQVVWLLIMMISVRLYKKKEHQGNDRLNQTLEPNHEDTNQHHDSSSTKGFMSHQSQPQDFLFSARPISLFVKIGVTVLSLGYLLQSGLKLGENALYLSDRDWSVSKCTSKVSIAMNCLQCLYVFYQMFFAFKFSNLIINKWFVFFNFGIIHCIGTSITFSVYIIIEEVMFSVSISPEASSTSTEASTLDSIPNEPLRFLDLKIYDNCTEATALSSFAEILDPILFTFCIQTNLIMVGLWILLWQNIGKTERACSPKPTSGFTANEVHTSSRFVINVDCHASNRGLFAGLMMIVSAVIVIILYYTFAEDSNWGQALLIRGIWQLIAHILMILATLLTFRDMHCLDIVKIPINPTNDILLYICLPFVFLYSFFLMIPYIDNGNMLQVALNLLRIIHAILQTLLITNGLRRCSNAEINKNKKPGREYITFLLVCNIATWLIMAFQFNYGEGYDILYKFYGKELFIIASKVTHPLALFYLFHSSICFAEIWEKAYETEFFH